MSVLSAIPTSLSQDVDDTAVTLFFLRVPHVQIITEVRFDRSVLGNDRTTLVLKVTAPAGE